MEKMNRVRGFEVVSLGLEGVLKKRTNAAVTHVVGMTTGLDRSIIPSPKSSRGHGHVLRVRTIQSRTEANAGSALPAPVSQ